MKCTKGILIVVLAHVLRYLLTRPVKTFRVRVRLNSVEPDKTWKAESKSVWDNLFIFNEAGGIDLKGTLDAD